MFFFCFNCLVVLVVIKAECVVLVIIVYIDMFLVGTVNVFFLTSLTCGDGLYCVVRAVWVER